MPCTKCNTLPAPLPEEGTLYLAPPEGAIYNKIKTGILSMGIPVDTPMPNMLAVPIAPGDLDRICADVFAVLGGPERLDTRCVLLAKDEVPGLSTLLQMMSLSGLLARIDGQWLVDLIGQKRLTPYFQPIVSCQDPAIVFAYESLIRGVAEDGTLVPPSELFGRARSSELLFQLDRGSRLAIIAKAVELGIASNLFINFTPSAIYDPAYCLRTTVAAIEASQITPGQIVFEVVESSEIGDTDHLLRILDYYRSHGYRVALDDLGAGYSSLNLLTTLRPDFVKLDMHFIHHVDTDDYKARILSTLIDLARKLEIPVIAEGIETVGEWQWLKAAGADYLQGYLFARPAATPPVPQVPSL
jgi:EAL domain-containing protein (putative c-di-GMP-specific phosphodiesterase class I)